ncbi:MAG: hypothetical protein ACFE8J_00680, partial [Candidatus Heimdallarchaeota archaeon]
MGREKNTQTNDSSEIESEIYAAVNMILNLSQKYKNGDLKDSFFQKSIKNSMNDLVRINFILMENNILLSDLLERMHFRDKYYRAIDIINNISSLNFPNSIVESNYPSKSEFSKNFSSSLLELPGVTSKITSSFITLMDALKLEIIDFILITDLFKELIKNLEKFPGLEQIAYKVKKVNKNITKNIYKLEKSQKFRDFIGDEI